MTLLHPALELTVRHGLAVIPLHHPIHGRKLGAVRCSCPDGRRCAAIGKHPVRRGWTQAPGDAAYVRASWERWPEANIGVLTGRPLPGGGYLAVLDVDPRNGGDRSFEAMEAAHGRLPLTPRVQTAGGGEHYYFRSDRPLDSRKPVLPDLPGIELQARGTQVVAPPSEGSTHFYVWHPAATLGDVPLAPLPAFLTGPAAAPRAARVAGGPGVERGADDPLLAIPAREYVAELCGRTPDRRGFVQCPFHADGAERTPSLRLYDDRDHGWYCFGCRRGGSIYDFAGLIAGYPWPLPRGVPFLTVQATLVDHFTVKGAVA
jgi:hypothetical protein